MLEEVDAFLAILLLTIITVFLCPKLIVGICCFIGLCWAGSKL